MNYFNAIDWSTAYDIFNFHQTNADLFLAIQPKFLLARRGVRRQIIVYLYHLRIYYQFRDCCCMIYANALANYVGTQEATTNTKQRPRRPRQNINETEVSKKFKRFFETSFPDLHPVIEAYFVITNIVLFYMLLKGVFPLDRLVALFEFPLPAHCYVVGKFSLTDTVSSNLCTTFVMFHLAWRLFTFRPFSRTFELPLVHFLMEDDAIDPGEQKRMKKALESGEALSTKQVFLVLLLYNSFSYRHKTMYKLRLNRTERAYKEISSFMTNITLGMGATFCMAVLLVASLTVPTLFRDLDYLSYYPRCSPQLDSLKAAGRLARWSFTWSWHRFISFILDLTINVLIWWDSGTALCVVVPQVFIYEFDLYYYWNEIDIKLRALERTLKNKMNDECVRNFVLQSLGAADAKRRSPQLAGSGAKLGRRQAFQQQRQLARQALLSAEGNLDLMVLTVQAEMHDFFIQLKKVDRLVSLPLTASMIAWVLIFAYSTYISITYSVSDITFDMLFLVGIAGVFSTLFNFVLLSLRKKILSSYTTLCSIIAYDRSRYRIKFRGTLDFFSTLKYTSFTVFDRFPYTLGTFLSVFGYSLSVAIVSQTLMRA